VWVFTSPSRMTLKSTVRREGDNQLTAAPPHPASAGQSYLNSLHGAWSAQLHLLKGHGLCRAGKQPENSWALVPEGWIESIQYAPPRLNLQSCRHS